MKAFAEYFKENEMTYRRNTILQFGESWNLIGNIVLANPGSATLLSGAQVTSILKIREFYTKYRHGSAFNEANWFEFSAGSRYFCESLF